MKLQQHDKILIIGLGKTGFSCVEYLSKKNFNITIVDPKPQTELLQKLKNNFPEVTFIAQQDNLPACDAVILSPGVNVHLPEIIAIKQQNVPIYSDLDLFVATNTQPIIGITGSNGKSTVTSLVHLMLQANNINIGLGGNIGIPVLSLLTEQKDSWVFELSSFQLELVHNLPTAVSCILNIAPDHLDRHLEFTNYMQAKQKIYLHSDFVVFNRDDPNTIPKKLTQNYLTFGYQPPKNIHEFGLDLSKQYIMHDKQKILPIKNLKILGKHNIINAMSAITIVYAYLQEIPQKSLAALCNFPGLEHRTEKVATINNVIWINDSKGTNIAATTSVLINIATTILGKWIIILGGILKEPDLSPLIEPIRNHCKLAILLGRDQEKFFTNLKDVLPCIKVDSLSNAIKTAYLHAKPNDGVLLSPACASFDMFNDYIHRGNTFKELVEKIKNL